MLDCRSRLKVDKIEEFVDERQKSWCIHCGAWIGGVETNKDHVPSRALLLKPHPANLPVVQICSACNKSFSANEEYLFRLCQVNRFHSEIPVNCRWLLYAISMA